VAGLVALLLLALPILELIVIIKVGAAIGALDAVALLVLVSLVGVWLVKRQGLAVLRRAHREVESGRLPTASLLDGVILLVAGALLIFPGFVTDVVAVLLLLPPVRVLVRRWLQARYGRRISGTVVRGGTFGVQRRTAGSIVDADSHPSSPPERGATVDPADPRHEPPELTGG
jgi:UPF0716 protein FxsA